MKNLLLTASLLFGAVLSGIEIAPGTRWTLYPASNTALTEQNGTIRITLGKMPEKSSYASIYTRFPKPLNCSDFRNVEVTLKSSQKIKLMCHLGTKAGTLTAAWDRVNIGPEETTVVFDRAAFKGKEAQKGDPAAITGITLGFGLWMYDTAKETAEIEITKIRITQPADSFLIPRPTAGVAIDGAYRTDWGFENNLYFWTPPEYLHLTDGHAVGSKLKTPERLSGKFSFMYDENHLYLLGIIADATPGQGKPGTAEPWTNDSVELFLANGVTSRDLEKKTPLKGNGIQIIFDCSANGKPTLYKNGKKMSDGAISAKVQKGNVMVNGNPVSGYVLEAAIPLSLLPVRPEKGSLLAYCINLNDQSGAALRSSPRNETPNSSLFQFGKAYFEFQGGEKKAEYKFGPPAANPHWPEEFHADGKRLWDDSLLERRTVSSTAKRLYLNGFWAVQGTKEITQSPDPEQWFYVPVPMTIGWATPVYALRNGKLYETHANGTNITDNGKNSCFWYERLFSIPADWKGKDTRITLEYATKEALVFLNGKFAGIVDPVMRTLNVSPFLLPGKINRVDIQVIGKMEPGIGITNGKTGLTGDVYLETSARRPVLSDIWIRKADGIDRTFRFQIKTESLGKGSLNIRLDSPDGKRLYSGTKPIAPNRETVFEGRCPEAPAWSTESPKLCKLTVRAANADGTVVEERILPVGFRRFESKNAHFQLNGKIIRLRVADHSTPSRVFASGWLEQMKKRGYNSIYLHSSDIAWHDPLYELLDRKGFLIIAPIDRTLSDSKTIEAVRLVRNHPSVIGYISDAYGQLDGNGFIHNPFATDDSYMPSGANAKKIEAFMERRDALFKKADPERGYIAQATGNWKDYMRMTHHYPANGLNLLDRMMYHHPWSRRANPKLPLHIFEAGAINLYTMDTTHPEHFWPVGTKRLPAKRLLTFEAAARYLGDEAFENRLEWDRMLFQAKLRDYRLNGVDAYCLWINSDIGGKILNTETAGGVSDKRRRSWRYFTAPFAEIMEDSWMRVNPWYYRLRALTTYPWGERYGHGGLKPEDNIFSALYRNESQPLYLTIAGEEGDLFSQDHNYYGGELLKRRIAAVNDTLTDQTINGTVALNVNGKTVQTLPVKGTAGQGTTVFFPFEFRLPEVSRKTPAELLLNANGRTERRNLTLFPKHRKPEFNGTQKIGISSVKPEKLTEKAGIRGIPVALEKGVPAGIDVLIIERDALTPSVNRDSLARFLNNGGRILIFEQTDSSLYSHRAEERRLEHGFITDRTHLAVTGLDDRDLCNWRGRAESVPNEKRPSDAFRHNQAAALETPHLTNRNLIAGYVLATPSYGSFLPVVTGGFDRTDALILDARSGKGRILFCQADVSSRYGIDPAATILADNLFRTILAPAEPQLNGVRYSGNEAGKIFLNRLGIGIDNSSPVGVLGAGGDPRTLAECKTIVLLPSSEFLPDGTTVKRTHLRTVSQPLYWNTTYYQFEFLKGELPGTDFPASAGPFFRGLSASDFYLFENPMLKIWDFKPGTAGKRSRFGTAAELAGGGKTYLFCALDPSLVKYGEEREKIYRIWSVLFHNLGIRNAHGISFRTPDNDLTNGAWTFLTDPDGKGEEHGFARGEFGGRIPRPIHTGAVWEDQGVTEQNPHLPNPPDSGYDGYGWYFTTLNLNKVPEKTVYFHINGVRDISTFNRTEHKTDLYINGKKMPAPTGVYNAYHGGRGARLWTLDASVLKPGKNRIAVRIYNSIGAGGIHKNPVRFEFRGKNTDLLFPYEFRESKYTNYFFWCW